MVKNTDKKETKKPITKKTVAKKPVVKKAVAKKVIINKKVIKKSTVKQDSTKTFKCLKYTLFIKNIFLDFITLFKNFIHWNISKIVIYIWSIIFWLLLSLPFLIIYNIFWDVSFLDIYKSLLVNISINPIEPFYFNIAYLYQLCWTLLLLLANLDFLLSLYIVAWILFILSFLYSNFLLIRLYLSYLNWDKMHIKNNDYFNYKKILKFFSITIVNMLILFIPALIYGLLFWIMALIVGDVSELNELVTSWPLNYFSVITFILLFIFILFTIYTFYRIIFSYFILSDDKYYKIDKSSFSYIRDSLNKTKWLKWFFKFTIIFIIFYILLVLIKYISFLLITIWGTNNSVMLFFLMFYFLLLWNSFLMLITSFYKRELK